MDNCHSNMAATVKYSLESHVDGRIRVVDKVTSRMKAATRKLLHV